MSIYRNRILPSWDSSFGECDLIAPHSTWPIRGIHCRAILGFPSIIMIMLLNHEHARICWHWLNVGFAKSGQSMWKSKLLTQLCSIHISLGLEYHTPACTSTTIYVFLYHYCDQVSVGNVILALKLLWYHVLNQIYYVDSKSIFFSSIMLLSYS